MTPAPRKCETERCEHKAAEPVRVENAIDQSYGKRPGWVWTCLCEWKQTRMIPLDSENPPERS